MHRSIFHSVVGSAVLGIFCAALAGAQPTGFLDDRFFGDGTTTVAPGGDPSALRAVAVTPSGRLVVAGFRETASAGQGTLFWQTVGDDSIGPLCSPTAPGGGLYAFPTALAFDSAGRLLVAGAANFASIYGDAILLRYLYPDCTLDTAFSGDGVFSFALDRNERFEDLAIDASGRIVATGFRLEGYQTQLVARVLENGVADGTFSSDGWLELDWGSGAEFGQLALQADGRIVAGGTIDGGALGTTFVVARFDDSGALDPDFNGDGYVTFEFPLGVDDRLRDLAIDPTSGKILAAGSSDDVAPLVTRSVAARLTPSGTLDPTFDGDGRWVRNVFDRETIVAIELQSDGRMLLVGDAADQGGTRDFFAYRVNPDGDVDGSYGFFGVAFAPFDLGASNADLALAATLQAGALVVVGSADSATGAKGAVARFWSDLIFADGFARGDRTAWTASAP